PVSILLIVVDCVSLELWLALYLSFMVRHIIVNPISTLTRPLPRNPYVGMSLLLHIFQFCRSRSPPWLCRSLAGSFQTLCA
ncbi:hypothetical protein L9F63_013849, partial [Diploptera punctata]